MFIKEVMDFVYKYTLDPEVDDKAINIKIDSEEQLNKIDQMNEKQDVAFMKDLITSKFEELLLNLIEEI